MASIAYGNNRKYVQEGIKPADMEKNKSDTYTFLNHRF